MSPADDGFIAAGKKKKEVWFLIISLKAPLGFFLPTTTSFYLSCRSDHLVCEDTGRFMCLVLKSPPHWSALAFMSITCLFMRTKGSEERVACVILAGLPSHLLVILHVQYCPTKWNKTNFSSSGALSEHLLISLKTREICTAIKFMILHPTNSVKCPGCGDYLPLWVQALVQNAAPHISFAYL